VIPPLTTDRTFDRGRHIYVIDPMLTLWLTRSKQFFADNRWSEEAENRAEFTPETGSKF
jgi:hypothetical protein